MTTLNNLTWTCHICGEERPDAKISVFSRDISAQFKMPEGTSKMNVRYCNDRESCITAAPTFSFFPK